MLTHNPIQLKAFIKKNAVEKNISAQLVMQNYMLESQGDSVKGKRRVTEISGFGIGTTLRLGN